MRIKQGYVSSALHKLKDRYMTKYDLIPYTNIGRPLVMFGMYKDVDYQIMNNHEGHLTIVWCGSDSIKINRKRSRYLKQRKPRNIAKSEFISKDLKIYKHEVIPVSACSLDYDCEKRGDSIYFYGTNEIYGISYLKEIRSRTGLNIIHAQGEYSQDQVRELYKQSFIGLRLTKHDGLPNTVLELGMMGRRSIYNGNIPHSIRWVNIDDICNSIMKEYEKRHEDNTDISTDIKRFIDIKDSWLHVRKGQNCKK